MSVYTEVLTLVFDMLTSEIDVRLKACLFSTNFMYYITPVAVPRWGRYEGGDRPSKLWLAPPPPKKNSCNLDTVWLIDSQKKNY